MKRPPVPKRPIWEEGPTIPITVTVPRALVDEVDSHCREWELSRSAAFTHALRRFLRGYRKRKA